MNISNRIASLADEVAGWRRDIHANPELGYSETRTSRIVTEKLREFGFDEIRTGMGKTGVVGVLHGSHGAGTGESDSLMLRADMDALPIQEESGVPHASTRDGVMHACGHDGHTAILLGAAKHLAETRNFRGSAYFCFQPAEEGGAGAAAMIRDGLLKEFPCKAVFGLHNWPGLATGEFGIRPGPVMARADQFRIDITGSGSHAAQPHHSRDPITAAAAIIQGLQTVVSRNVDPIEPAVVSVTQMRGGDAFNVIPDKVMLGGTVRSFDDELHVEIYERVRQLATGIARGFGTEAAVERATEGYPPTVNDAAATEFAASVADDVSGENAVDRDFPMTAGGEDFAYLAQERPGAFIFLGAGESHPRLHTSGYDFNDEIIPVGISYWTRLVERGLPAAH